MGTCISPLICMCKDTVVLVQIAVGPMSPLTCGLSQLLHTDTVHTVAGWVVLCTCPVGRGAPLLLRVLVQHMAAQVPMAASLSLAEADSNPKVAAASTGNTPCTWHLSELIAHAQHRITKN